MPKSWRPSARTGYDGWLTVELYPFLDDPDAAARAALEVLRPAARNHRARRGRSVFSPMPKTIVAYLQLVRLPNVVTAAADSLAGWLLVTGSLGAPSRWLPLVAASMVLYASGTMLNDVFDFEDRPPGTTRPAVAVGPGLAGARPPGSAGWGWRWGRAWRLRAGRPRAACWPRVLALTILGYDAGVKRTWLGPVVMGACRGLNLLLGMSHAAALGGPVAWLAALAYGIFVAGITIASRSEADGAVAPAAGRRACCSSCWRSSLWRPSAVRAQRFPAPGAGRPVIPLEGLLVLALVALALSSPPRRDRATQSPSCIQKYVKTGILSLVWLHVGLVAAVRGPELALPIAALWVPAFILGRWLYST